MKFKLLFPVVTLGLLLLTPLTSLTASAHSAASGSATTIRRPGIQEAQSCPDKSYTYIYYNYGNNSVCFGGDGYMGIGPNLFNVTHMDTGVNCGWVLVYYSGSGHYQKFDSNFRYGWAQPNKITQIDIQGQNCQGHYP